MSKDQTDDGAANTLAILRERAREKARIGDRWPADIKEFYAAISDVNDFGKYDELELINANFTSAMEDAIMQAALDEIRNIRGYVFDLPTFFRYAAKYPGDGKKLERAICWLANKIADWNERRVQDGEFIDDEVRYVTLQEFESVEMIEEARQLQHDYIDGKVYPTDEAEFRFNREDKIRNQIAPRIEAWMARFK